MVRNIYRWLVVAHIDPAQLNCLFEVHVIRSPLWKHLDCSDHIPSATSKSLDKTSSNIGVSI
jgi:hypothetical protein